MITITESAQDYLAELLSKQEDALGVRVFINQPGTPRAETCIAYCREGDVQGSDEERAFDKFTAWFDGHSLPFLEDALVDYAKDRMGGQLTIKAPNAKMPRVDENSPLSDRINYVLYNEVNPALAAHGGEVSLVEITAWLFYCAIAAYWIIYLGISPAFTLIGYLTGSDAWVAAGAWVVEPWPMFLIGSEMDWVEDKLASRFVFNNPNAKGVCGCGESFHV